jgi:hypothetical protein
MTFARYSVQIMARDNGLEKMFAVSCMGGELCKTDAADWCVAILRAGVTATAKTQFCSGRMRQCRLTSVKVGYII